VIQQLREALPYDSVPGYLIFDRAASFSEEIVSTIEAFGIQPKRTGFQSPLQNGVAERWVGSGPRDLLDHAIVLNERHLKRLMSEYIRYYQETERIWQSPKKRPPAVGGKHRDTNCNIVSSQGSVVCIIATIWPPEHRQFSAKLWTTAGTSASVAQARGASSRSTRALPLSSSPLLAENRCQNTR
jgi:hypothetical protein